MQEGKDFVMCANKPYIAETPDGRWTVEIQPEFKQLSPWIDPTVEPHELPDDDITVLVSIQGEVYIGHISGDLWRIGDRELTYDLDAVAGWCHLPAAMGV